MARIICYRLLIDFLSILSIFFIFFIQGEKNGKQKKKTKVVGVVKKIGKEKIFIEKTNGGIIKATYDDFVYDPSVGDRVRISRDADGDRIIGKLKKNPSETTQVQSPYTPPSNDRQVHYKNTSPYNDYGRPQKKSFYKKKKFWIILIVVLFIVYALETEDTSPKLVEPTSTESSKTDDSTVSADSNSNNEIRVFTIGDTASINGYEIRVNKVEYSSGGEWMKPDEGIEFVIVNLTITNNSKEKKSFNLLDYSLNVDGVSTTMGFTLTEIDTIGSGDLDVGASVTGNVVGEAPPGTKLKLRYEGNFFIGSEEVDFDLR